MPPKIPVVKTHGPGPRSAMVARQKPRYTDEEKMRAVSVMVRLGGGTVEALDLARRAMDGSPSDRTLFKWYYEMGDRVRSANPEIIPVQKTDGLIVAESDAAILDILEKLVRKLLNELNRDDKIDKAAYRDLAVTMGIVSDKIMKMTGFSAEMTVAIKDLSLACAEKRISPVDAVRDITEQVRQFKPQPSIDAVVVEEVQP